MTPTLAWGEFQEVIISLLSRPPALSWAVCWQRCWICNLCLSCALLLWMHRTLFNACLAGVENWWWLVEGLLRWPRRWPEGAAHLCSMECYPLRFLLPVPDFCFLFSGFLRCHQLEILPGVGAQLQLFLFSTYLAICSLSPANILKLQCIWKMNQFKRVNKRIIELNWKPWIWNLILMIPAGLWTGKGLQDPKQKCLLFAISLCHV